MMYIVVENGEPCQLLVVGADAAESPCLIMASIKN